VGLTRFDAAYTYGFYDGALRELVHLLKYRGVEPLAGKLGALMAQAVPRQLAFDGVVAMPLHWWRRWRRGFNQAELLGREVARRLGLPVLRAVRRTRLTRTQTGLTSAGRRRNVAGAFRVCDRGAITGKRILLVDDVLTTGATVNACAAALKSAGAKHVAVLTLARADRRRWVEATISNIGSGRKPGHQATLPASEAQRAAERGSKASGTSNQRGAGSVLRLEEDPDIERGAS
jgi:ComF family protein